MAEYLLGLGARINATPGYANQSAIQVAGAGDTRRQTLVDWLRTQSAEPLANRRPRVVGEINRRAHLPLVHECWDSTLALTSDLDIRSKSTGRRDG